MRGRQGATEVTVMFNTGADQSYLTNYLANEMLCWINRELVTCKSSKSSKTKLQDIFSVSLQGKIETVKAMSMEFMLVKRATSLTLPGELRGVYHKYVRVKRWKIIIKRTRGIKYSDIPIKMHMFFTIMLLKMLFEIRRPLCSGINGLIACSSYDSAYCYKKVYWDPLY